MCSTMALTQKVHDIEMWIISAILDGLMVIDKKKDKQYMAI